MASHWQLVVRVDFNDAGSQSDVIARVRGSAAGRRSGAEVQVLSFRVIFMMVSFASVKFQPRAVWAHRAIPPVLFCKLDRLLTLRLL